MTENDYIAEYIKEKHASLLGFDFFHVENVAHGKEYHKSNYGYSKDS